MKNLIKLSLAMLMVVYSFASFAQKGPKKSVDERAKMVVTKLTEKLALTDEQQKKATEIFTNHFNEVKALRESSKDQPKEQVKASIKELRKKNNVAFRAILTEEQKAKLVELRKEKRDSKKAKAKTPSDDELLDDAGL
jgi:Spy/CpxP family protein refolding chaperone